MKKFKDTFLCEFCKSVPFKMFVVFVVAILLGMYITECNNHKKVVRMREDVLYIKPMSDTAKK